MGEGFPREWFFHGTRSASLCVGLGLFRIGSEVKNAGIKQENKIKHPYHLDGIYNAQELI